MSETIETARRWSGYVCPDCRFVFRVPRDHDGSGIVCPSCRRMLKIPTSHDTPPPLLAPPPPAGETEPQVLKMRRRKKDTSEDNQWEQEGARSGKSDKRQMRYMLIGGVVLFILITGGVMVAMNFGERPEVVVAPPVENFETIVAAAASARDNNFLLSEAEPLVKSFLEATTVEMMLPLVRNREVAEPRIRAFHEGGAVKALGMAAFNSVNDAEFAGKRLSIVVRTRNFEDKHITLFDTPEGLKVDWESWVGWSEMPWEKLLSTKPTQSLVFRATLSPVEYYNFGFSDETKWQSYRLESPDRQTVVFGYVTKDSDLDKKLRLSPDVRSAPFTLSLKFPQDSSSPNQVEIENLISEGWVESEQ